MPTRLRFRKQEARRVRLALRTALEERGFRRVRARGRDSDVYLIGRSVLIATCWTDEHEEDIELRLESVDAVAFGSKPDTLGLDYEVENCLGKRQPRAFPHIAWRVLHERTRNRPIGWVTWWCDAKGLEPIEITRMAIDLQLLFGRIELIGRGGTPPR